MSNMIQNRAFADVVAKVRARIQANPVRGSDEAHDLNTELARELGGHDFAGQLADKVAIGDDCMPCAPRAGNKSPVSCFRGGVKFCDLIRTGGRLAAAVAGQAAWNLQIEPGAGSDFFEPLGFRGAAFDNAAFSIPRHEGLFITSITVGRTPQEAFDAAAAAAITAGVHFQDYIVPDWCHCPVAWAPFGRITADKNLNINGFSLWPAATNTMIFGDVVGNAFDALGALMDCCSATGRCTPNIPGWLRARYAGNGKNGSGAAG